DGGAGGYRYRNRSVAGTATRNRHDRVRDAAVRVARAHAHRRPQRPLERDRGNLREVGSRRCGHRARARRRPHARVARRPSRLRRAGESVNGRGADLRSSDEASFEFRVSRSLGEVESQQSGERLHNDGDTNSKLETRNSKLSSARNSKLNEALLRLLSSPNLASKEWVYRQYDHMVRTNTVVLPGADAAVVRIKETRKALAIALDGNGRYCAANPREGAKLMVAEAARNVVCVGAKPIAITNCLNFASPERPEVMWSFSEVIDGMAEAC